MKGLFTDPFVLGALGLVGVIAIASAGYYAIESRSPNSTPIPSLSSTASTTLTGSGTVEPAQNPDLAFETGGRVVRLNVAVGDTVTKGEVLAALDSSTLSAQRDQAAASEKAAEAQLSQLQAGARQVDISAKQTAVSQAQLSLANAYATVADNLNNAYGTTYSAVHTDTDSLFSNADSNTPTLNFTTTNNQESIGAVVARGNVNQELSLWKTSLVSLSSSDTVGLESGLTQGLAHLSISRNYANAITEALADAIPSASLSQSAINAAIVSVGAMRDTVAGQITALQTLSQQIAADKLAVQSAQDALNQTMAGATPDQINAQEAQVEAAEANVAALDAQIAKTVIVAPFAGTVSSVRIKKGDIASADTAAISLTPVGALQIGAYFSEIDIARITTGEHADVTLDAYGDSRVFSATVSAVDTSPTEQNGVPAYKVTLEFDQSDPGISPGMTANVTIK